MGKEMTLITRKTAQQVSEMYPSNSKSILKELFEAVMEQMRRIVKAHTVVLDSVKILLQDQQHNNDIVMYNKEDVWSQVQTVVCFIFHSFPDIKQFVEITYDLTTDPSPSFSILGYWTHRL